MKYSKITQKCTLLEQRATGIVTQQYKKFGGAKSKKKMFAECQKVILGIDVCLPSVVFWHSAYRITEIDGVTGHDVAVCLFCAECRHSV